MTFPSEEAPAPKVAAASGLPEGNQWRYSDFIGAVENGKVERVRFSKDGTGLQLTAVDGRRAAVTLPNDPNLVDTLATNGVDISVSEGEQQGSLVALLGNLLFPLIAFAGLFFLFRRANNGSSGGGGMGGMGGMGGGGPMEFGKSKSKFQEVPDTGVLFADVAGAAPNALHAVLYLCAAHTPSTSRPPHQSSTLGCAVVQCYTSPMGLLVCVYLILLI